MYLVNLLKKMKENIPLEQWFLNLSMHPNHLDDLW